MSETRFDRHYTAFAAAILALALFNLTFRLNQEFVSEWDESLYAMNAWEVVSRNSWVAITFLGQVDYYNSKPPLMVWLIALAFKAFGPGLVSLRIVSALSAWVTVLVLQIWTKRAFGPRVALLSSLVLATTFGFVHVHSGRSAATDAPFTLIVLLTAVTLWAERDRPSQRFWLGPIIAAAFMLRGMAILMPLALVAAMWMVTKWTRRVSLRYTLGAMALFILPVVIWGVARYRFDEWAFFQRVFMYDFVARTVSAIEAHPGGPFFYLDELQKNQFDWLLAGVVGFLLFPVPWRDMRAGVRSLFGGRDAALMLAVLAAVTFVIPSLMATKVPWYLNTFFPAFSVAVALSVARAFEVAQSRSKSGWRFVTLAAVLAVVVIAAESRLIWYSFHHRDLSLSDQSLVLRERERLRGRRVYVSPHSEATHFVVDAVVGGQAVQELDAAKFNADSRAGDYLVTSRPCDATITDEVTSNARHFLCVRR